MNIKIFIVKSKYLEATNVTYLDLVFNIKAKMLKNKKTIKDDSYLVYSITIII